MDEQTKKIKKITNLINFPFFLFLISIQINVSLTDYFDTLRTGSLNLGASLIDITDYNNIYPLITSDKKIYTGIPPTMKTTTYSKIITHSSAFTYNENFIIIGCTQNYLLSKINILNGEEIPIINYQNFSFPNYTCSISGKDNFVYIGISHIKIPIYKIQYNNNSSVNSCAINDTTCSDINDSNYYYIYDYINSYLENSVIKIKLINNVDDGPILDEDFNIITYTFEYQNHYLEQISIDRPFSCEIINIGQSDEEARLVCGYLIITQNSGNGFSYRLNVSVMNSNFDGIDDNREIYSENNILYFRLQRIDDYNIRYIYKKYSKEISLKKEDGKCKIEISTKTPSLNTFKCTAGLFYYYNQYLFYVYSSAMFIKRNISENYIQVEDIGKSIQKIIGYFDEEEDILMFVYEYYPNKIKYFTIEGRSNLFELKGKSRILNVKSNTFSEVNVSELIINPIGNELLSLNYLVHYISTRNYNYTYDKYNFDKNTQLLTVNESLNDWITFYFYFLGQTSEVSISFFVEESFVKIKTCKFKCGECSSDFSVCNIGTCKENLSLYRDSPEIGCFPSEQNLPNYTYNETTKYFERCYESCIFCSLDNEFSSSQFHNCKACQEGYLRSYNFPGNCYPIDYPQNSSNYSKIVKETGFEIVESCFDLNKYQINDTGECVESCPENSIFYTYYLNESLNFSTQEENFIGILYPIEKEKAPKFLFNKVCYSKCPNLTYEDNTNKICKCKYGWHKDELTNEDICYNMDYCLSLNYYYHTDNKECVLGGCKDGYYQINFECYNNSCPDGSIQTSTTEKKCQSKLKYCYIDEHYKTQCSNNPYEGYNLKYDNTNIYFRTCNESFYYFNIETYLYKNTCYKDCPEETTKNETNKKCTCNYYTYYVNDEKTDYECLKETEKCWDKKRYNITEEKECANTRQQCLDLGYKIYNDECLIECPVKDEIIEDNSICLCHFFYYNESNYLTCYENGATCESKNYPIKMSNTNECFKNKFECIKRGFKFFNNICYETCPSDITIEQNNDGICRCQNSYFNETDYLTCFNSGETCEDKNYLYTNIDTNECFNSLNDCIDRGLKIFNGQCYNNCPENTIPKNDDSSCVCSNYFYTEDNGNLNCFSSDKTCETESTEYLYTNFETKECFKTEEECFNKGLKKFNNECLINCPTNTVDKNNNNICLCSTFTLYDENDLLKCFASEIDCVSQGYFFNKETKQCFLSDEECINNNKKIFGKECVNSCPVNSGIKSNPNECECSYFFYNNNGILNCFNSEKTCETENYGVDSDTKECFTSINECFSKNYLYYFENTCYKNSCPSDKIPLNSITDSHKKNAFINELNLDNTQIDKICICDTTNKYMGWTIKSNSNPYSQKCLYQCPYEYDLDSVTNKCYYSCDPTINFVFNNECYKSECPEGTHVENSNSKICICEGNTKIDEETGLTICEDVYPDLYNTQPEKCPFIYSNQCVLKCPENTCLTANNIKLEKCIDKKPNMKIYNQICIEGIDNLIQNLEDENLAPISTNSGVTINAFSADSSMEELIKKNPNLTFVNLGECKKNLIDAYNLPDNSKLYIIGIDSPCLYDNSSINVFSYEIYLENGTQLKDLSACDRIKITISSNINDLDSVNFYKALEFYDEGYDIYNRSNIFYVDPCSPAQDNGNDITLVDRAKYYYPNVSICNDGCSYNIVDFNTKRFVCECNANLTSNIDKNKNGENVNKEIEDETYLEYFLSLINYKIFLCINLFFKFESFYYNAGFYISFCTMLICVVLMVLFWIIGLKFIKVLIYRNVPTKEKLKELMKKEKRRKTENNKKNKRSTKRKKTSKSTQKYKFKDSLINDYKNKNKKNNKKRTVKNSTITDMNLINYNNPPPKSKNITKLKDYMKLRNTEMKKKEKEEYKFMNFINQNLKKKSETIIVRSESENKINNFNDITKRNKNKFKTSKIKRVDNSFLSQDIMKNKLKQKTIEKKNQNSLITEKEENYSSNVSLIKNSKKSIYTKKEKDLKKTKNIKTEPSSEKNINLKLPKIVRIDKKYHTVIIKSKYNILKKRNNLTRKELIQLHKKKMIEDLELKIDFTFEHLINRRDLEVEKRELNNIPYRQALRIDKRSFFEILFSVLTNQIEIISLFLYRNPYSHYTLTISIYLFELLFDLTVNCFLYTDDVVSEKYHNDGDLTMFTSLSLSFMSNIISSIVVFLIAKLTNYAEIIEAIIINVKDKKKYILNIIRLFKYIKIRLGLFYFLQLTFILIMTYYLFIFCTVYHQSQGSIMFNYFVGACISLSISVGLTLIISILRTISIKYHYYQLYNVSKYLYEHF